MSDGCRPEWSRLLLLSNEVAVLKDKNLLRLFRQAGWGDVPRDCLRPDQPMLRHPSQTVGT